MLNEFSESYRSDAVIKCFYAGWPSKKPVPLIQHSLTKNAPSSVSHTTQRVLVTFKFKQVFPQFFFFFLSSSSLPCSAKLNTPGRQQHNAFLQWDEFLGGALPLVSRCTQTNRTPTNPPTVMMDTVVSTASRHFTKDTPCARDGQ